MLENAALISSIFTPIILAGMGWLIPHELAKGERKRAALADFNSGWNKLFSDACLEFNDAASEFASLFFDIKSKTPEAVEQALVAQANLIRRIHHKIRVYSGVVDGANLVVCAVDDSNEWMNQTFNNRRGNFDELLNYQKRLTSALRQWKREQTGI